MQIRPISPRRYTLLAAVTVSVSLAASLALAEYVLRWQRQAVETSDNLDPGMVRYDASLGWRLTPGWTGAHRHHDFQVAYRIGPTGYRGPGFPEDDGERVAVLGDSFTFGIGVGEGETLVDRLNEKDGRRAWLNAAVPGYGTDQQLLQFRHHVVHFRPQRVVLVVYLANDLIDNTRPFPLQAPYAKPYFTLHEGGLRLHNQPVPRVRKPPELSRETFARVVAGDLPDSRSGPARALGGLELARRLGLFQPRLRPTRTYLDERFGPAVELFRHLVTALQDEVKREGAELLVALLPGRSFFAHPDGASARFQDYLRRAILEMPEVATVDLAPALADGGAGLFHPKEGHLTATGHRRVADTLLKALPP